MRGRGVMLTDDVGCEDTAHYGWESIQAVVVRKLGHHVIVLLVRWRVEGSWVDIERRRENSLI